jgi:hypothetical protein
MLNKGRGFQKPEARGGDGAFTGRKLESLLLRFVKLPIEIAND